MIVTNTQIFDLLSLEDMEESQQPHQKPPHTVQISVEY